VGEVACRLRERDATERVERALGRVSALASQARLVREEIADGVLERERLAWRGEIQPDRLDAAPCPYKGLARFEATDVRFFCGRERLVATLASRLAVDRFVGIVGASGSGKSSLVRAGLLPALAAGMLPGSEEWASCVCTPGEHPLRRLSNALAQVAAMPPAQPTQSLELQADHIHALLTAAIRGRPGSRVVVVVDQFEELATLCRDPAERQRFAAVIADIVADPHLPAAVVPVIRADYYGALAGHPELAQLFEQSQLLVGAMTEAELRRAIVEPATRIGMVVEDGVADAICADAGAEPGALPLVSTALVETWIRREGATLTLVGYRDAGGVQGALARMAERVYEGFDDAGKALVRGLFLRLAETGEDTDDVRRRMPRAEFDGSPAADTVLDTLVAGRLIVVDHNSVEVAHEALLREWPRLRTWLEEDREGRRTHRRLTDAASAWDAEGREPGSLYRGARLDGAQDWASLHPEDTNRLEQEFLSSSLVAQDKELRAARRTARRSRSLAGALAAVLAVALAAAGVAVAQRSRANNKSAAARREAAAARRAQLLSDAARLAIQARSVPKLDLALLLGVEGWRLYPSDTTVGALESILNRVTPGLDRRVSIGDPGICQDVSPDGRFIAVADRNGTVRLYDTSTGQILHTLAPALGPSACFLFSDDSTQLGGASQDNNGLVIVWDVETGREVGAPIRAAPGATGWLHQPGRFVTVSSDGTLQIWDTADPKRFTLAEPPVNLGHVHLSFIPFLASGVNPNLVAVPAGTATQVWDIAARRQAYPALPGAAVGQTHDARILVTATANDVYLWDAATGHALGQPINIALGTLTTAAWFSLDGTQLALDAQDGIRVIDVASHRPIGGTMAGTLERVLADGRVAALDGADMKFYRISAPAPPFAVPLGSPAGGPVLATFTAGGSRVLTRLNDCAYPDCDFNFVGAPQAWDASSGHSLGSFLTGIPLASLPHDATWSLSADGALVAIGRPDGKVEVWDTAQAGRVTTFATGHQAPTVTWSPEGRLLATGSRDGTFALWDATDPTHVIGLSQTNASGFVANVLPAPVFSPDGKLLLAFGLPTLNGNPGLTSVALLTVPALMQVQLLRLGSGYAGTPAFSPDSREVAITVVERSTGNGRVMRWSTQTGAGRPSLELPYTPASVAYLAGGAWLATSQVDIPGTTPEVSEVAFWDAATLQRIGDSVVVAGDAGFLDTDRPGGYRFASGTTSLIGTPMVWDTDPAHWVDIACRIAGRNLTRAEWTQYLPGRPYQATCPNWPVGL
jgi:WD40 repeat protein